MWSARGLAVSVAIYRVLGDVAAKAVRLLGVGGYGTFCESRRVSVVCGGERSDAFGGGGRGDVCCDGECDGDVFCDDERREDVSCDNERREDVSRDNERRD